MKACLYKALLFCIIWQYDSTDAIIICGPLVKAHDPAQNSYWRFNRYVCSQEGKELVIRKASWHNTLIRELSYLPYVFKESKRALPCVFYIG